MDTSNAQTLLTEAVTAYSLFSNTQEEATRTGMQLESFKSAQIHTQDYPQITVEPNDPLSWPKTISVDYGPENVSGIDGRARRGVMIIVVQNFPGVENASWEVSFDEYYIDDYKIDGTQTITYKGVNASEHPEYNCTVTSGEITSPEGKSFLFEQNTTREWINGYDTHYVLTKNIDDLCDDDYLITGEHSGVSSEGYTYTMSTKEALQVNVCCQWIMDGKMIVELQDAELNCEIDYRPGNDTGDMCNNLATFNIFGNTIPVSL